MSEALLALKTAYLGNDSEDSGGIKSYSLRLPLRQSAFVEILADQNNMSRNEIMVNLIKVGISEFFNTLAKDSPHDLKELQLEIDIYVHEALENLL
ncbi:MAG: hypothetical protein SPJ53_02550 [Lactobacillus amylovorus]|nr:hypothetical protein [Lactobacillus amylovorus]